MFLLTPSALAHGQRIRARTSEGFPFAKAPELGSDPVGLVRVGDLTKLEAEELLDWLEAHDYPPAEVSLDKHGFAVQWAYPCLPSP